MTPTIRSARSTSLALLCALAAAGCGNGAQPAASASTTPAALQLSAENVARATTTELVTGPALAGQLWPAREAMVRALVGGSIVSLSAERGQTVRQGAVIARIAARDLEESLNSAKAAVRSAETALASARTELQRTESLVKGGALAARDLEQARNAVASAESMVAAARSRETSAVQQLDDTVVRAPFTGIVNERPASPGDVVTPGTEIVSIIDPSSLRLEALVPSDEIARTKPGATVRFSVRGFPGETFTGTIERLSATADPVTRQVGIFVRIPNAGGRLIAGLFANGRVEAERHTGIVVPVAAVDETGPLPTVTRITGGKAERVAVTLGLRQVETELVEVRSGVAAGDVLILGSAKGVAAGTPVKVIG